MSKHTPGPWVFKANEARGDTDHIATVAWAGKYCVGVDYEAPHQTNYERHGSDEADARLIAAAPELLEALKTCLLIVEHLAKDSAPTTIEEARAAIARATGETQ